MAAPTPTPLAPDLEAALKRLKLRRIRQLAPEVLQTAKTQRWAPDEVLRTLVEAEIAARDTSNLNARIRAANFPVVKTLEEFQLTASSIPKPTYDYLAGLEWIDAAENVVLVGPPGTGKSHCETSATGPARVGTRLRTGGRGVTRSHTGSPSGGALGKRYVCPAAGAGPVHRRVA